MTVEEMFKEYALFLHQIPEEQLAFLQSELEKEQIIDGPIDRTKLIRLLETVITSLSSPSPYWLFILGRLCVSACEYDNLERIYGKLGDPLELLPFLARAHVYQNRLEEAQRECESFLSYLNESKNLELLGIFLVLEARFAQGMVYLYTRSFNDLEQVISNIKELINDSRIIEILRELVNPLNSIKLYYLILEATLGLYTGKPGLLRDVLLEVQQWIEDVVDPWWKGYYYNLLGIYHMQGQRLTDGIQALKKSYRYYKESGDLRGAAAVAGNIGTALILSGDAETGRVFLEDASETLIHLKNYYNAMGHCLTVSKSYLDEKNVEKAREFLNKSETLRVERQIKIKDPAFTALFCYMHSRLRNFRLAKHYLSLLDALYRERGGDDFYTSIWYHFAEAVFHLSKNNLSSAENALRKGLRIASKYRQHDFGLELSQLLLEVHLKRFLLDRKRTHLYGALKILFDLEVAVKETSYAYFKTLIVLMLGYLHVSLKDEDTVNKYLMELKKSSFKDKNEHLAREVLWFELRVKNAFQGSIEGKKDPWVTTDSLDVLSTIEVLRLISRLQFQQVNIGAGRQRDKKPRALLIVSKSSHRPVFSHVFDESWFLQEDLIGGLVVALSKLGTELFGADVLKRIEQDQFDVIVNPLDDDLMIALVIDEDNYDNRMKLRRVSDVVKNQYLEKIRTQNAEDSLQSKWLLDLRQSIDDIFGE